MGGVDLGLLFCEFGSNIALSFDTDGKMGSGTATVTGAGTLILGTTLGTGTDTGTGTGTGAGTDTGASAGTGAVADIDGSVGVGTDTETATCVSAIVTGGVWAMARVGKRTAVAAAMMARRMSDLLHHRYCANQNFM